MILHDTRSAAKFFAGSITNKVREMTAAGTNLLARPFREEGFKPLYPVLRSKTLTGLVISAAAMSEAWAAYGTGVDASSGLGYVQWIIMAIGLIFTLIMGISCGFAFKQDAANAKAQLIGTIMIPVLFAIIIYIFNKTLGITLTSSSTL